MTADGVYRIDGQLRLLCTRAALAQRWSASKAPPHCARLSALTSIERLQATFECVWQAPRTPPGGSMAGTIQSTTGLTVVTWQRPTVNPHVCHPVRAEIAGRSPMNYR